MRNRREFLSGIAATAVIAATGRVSELQAARGKANAKLAEVAFQPLPVGQIQPTQWLRDQLMVQASGLSGSLEKIFAEVGNSKWIGGDDTHDERGPYYADGLIPLAAALPGDAHLNERSRYWMNYVLTHQQPNGAIGPYPSSPPRGGDKEAIAARKDPNRYNWWPSMPMLKALMQWYEVSRDPAVLDALTAYFKFHAANAVSNPLFSWSKMRWIDEVYVLQWTYGHTGNPVLLDFARTLQGQGTDWVDLFSDHFPFTTKTVRADKNMEEHGVNVGQSLKASAVQYRLAGDPAQRVNYLAKFNYALDLLDRYHGQPSGIFSCDEFLAGREPQQGTELCTVAETLFSLEVGLSTFGDPTIADRIERIAYNALPGLFTEDMWAHQYVGESNQIFSGRMTAWPYDTDPGVSNMYGLAPRLGCCTANYQQAWPKLTASLWMRCSADGGNGLVAAIIAPSAVTQVINGVKVKVATVTDYPFGGKVRYTVTPESPVTFPLYFRIPEWAGDTPYTVNSGATGGIKATGRRGTYVRVKRKWKAGDSVDMSFDMTPVVSRGFNNSIAVHSGPLVFSLSLRGQWKKLTSYGDTKSADWTITPERPFNFALDIDQGNVASATVNRSPPSPTPFADAAPPVTITVQAKLLRDWTAEDPEKNYAMDPPKSPAQGDEASQTIQLQPFGSTRLRITSFPSLRS